MDLYKRREAANSVLSSLPRDARQTGRGGARRFWRQLTALTSSRSSLRKTRANVASPNRCQGYHSHASSPPKKQRWKPFISFCVESWFRNGEREAGRITAPRPARIEGKTGGRESLPAGAVASASAIAIFIVFATMFGRISENHLENQANNCDVNSIPAQARSLSSPQASVTSTT